MTQGARYDLLVVGGGINGAGIARDAAGRGLSVLLCEQDDLAAHTSSASTKLIHGGLRYLEYREFGLVRKALQERETLLRAAPHIMWPLRFVMPHMPNLRPAWLIRAGLFLYDHLARRELLPGSRGIDMRRHPAGAPLIDSIRRGFVYSDGWVDDARLVVLNALDASEHGATVLTRTKLVSAVRAGGEWLARLERADGLSIDVRAGAIANAAGPWVSELLQGALGRGATHSVRLVKGSHIVTRRLFEHDHAYIFQNPDKRIIFAIPYEHDYTLIGTTDIEYRDDPAQVAINADETQYLCDSINRYFKQQIAPADVCWTYSGVRPLLEEEGADNPSAVTRDYRLELDAPSGEAPLLSVFGGKITTFRKLAEEAVNALPRALRHACGAHRGQCALGRRTRPRVCTWPPRSRTALSSRCRMGTQRARRAVAALETRPASGRVDHARSRDPRHRRVVRPRSRRAARVRRALAVRLAMAPRFISPAAASLRRCGRITAVAAC